MPDPRMNTKMSKTKAYSYEASLLNIGRHGLRIVQKSKQKPKSEGGSLDEVREEGLSEKETFQLGPTR